MRILIWQTAFLGDVVLATPLIRSLQASFPEAEIAFVGRPFIADLLEGYGITLIPFSKGFGESFSLRGRIRGYDVAVVPHRSLRTALIVLSAGIPLRIGFDRSELRWAFNRVVPHRWDLHEVDRNLSLLEPLSPRKVIRETFLPVDERERKRVLEKLGLETDGYVVFNPFSNFPLKEWYPEGWAAVINELRNYTPVVTGTAADMPRAHALGKMAKFVNLVGRTSLRELMAVLSGARLVVSNDSSPVHIANAFGVPAVTVYTATSPDYGFYPLIGESVRNPAECSPCSPNPKKCRKGSPECLSAISPELVLESLEKLL